mmetsp:Transcript_59087/g.105044  ORF Transcript_59087/g.105044 Transcript_59087/m.105044 type:complete len:106 (-) Transcript_59087:272-589(-)
MKQFRSSPCLTALDAAAHEAETTGKGSLERSTSSDMDCISIITDSPKGFACSLSLVGLDLPELCQSTGARGSKGALLSLELSATVIEDDDEGVERVEETCSREKN